ncbi:unnamed protein product [Gongylonema pulchrum]|uniref:OB domain-containing protein n=1 Tax=Gongylonema pulchrum TaxID=637853 RepID=A0A183EYU3_9BILA|nr:unnamed protein product [Gongylonema pulchrum]
MFVHVGDGSTLKTVQAVVQRDVCPKVPVGSAVEICGDWVQSAGKQQTMELYAAQCQIVGLQRRPFNELPAADCSADVLRKKYHLRMKNVAFTCMLQLRSRLDQLTRAFFQVFCTNFYANCYSRIRLKLFNLGQLPVPRVFTSVWFFIIFDVLLGCLLLNG